MPTFHAEGTVMVQRSFDPAGAMVDSWFHSGYVAKFKGQGFYTGGDNLYPAEVINVIYQHPDVAEPAVIGIRHPRWLEVGLESC